MPDRAAPAFPVVELRRYAIRPGEADAFARCFDAWFPEAFEQLGVVIFGQGLERAAAPPRFVWLRGFPDVASRARAGHAFYDGPLWKSRAATMNDRLLDHTDVRLLRALDGGVPLLPPVDPAAPAPAAPGLILLHVLPVHDVAAAARAVEPARAAAATTGVREAGLLATLDAANNFPRHPVRSDGPDLVWLGLAADEPAATAARAAAERAAALVAAAGQLRAPADWLVIEPTPRSRLRACATD